MQPADHPVIERVSLAHLQALTHLGQVTFAEAYAAQNTAADIAHYTTHYLNEQYTRLDIEDPGTAFYMAFVKGEPAGYIKIKQMPTDLLGNPGPVLELKRIYVLRQFYGSGLARQLLDIAFERALALGLPAVNLAVWKENHRAIKFYMKTGFETVGETIFDWGTGKIDHDWVMVKKTGNPAR